MVSTPLKNISQNGNLPQIGVKIKNIWNHHPALQYKHWVVPVVATALFTCFSGGSLLTFICHYWEGGDNPVQTNIIICIRKYLYAFARYMPSWWLNHPSEKYARQIGFIFPKDRGENKTKYLSCHHLEVCWPTGVLIHNYTLFNHLPTGSTNLRVNPTWQVAKLGRLICVCVCVWFLDSHPSLPPVFSF